MKFSLITATHHRPDLLATQALPSVLQQEDTDFEWIVINDGQDPETGALIRQVTSDISINYIEIPHLEAGFGLCRARNIGLQRASGDLVGYLDDDNQLVESFTRDISVLFDRQPSIRCVIPRQLRRRDIVRNGQCHKRGKSFISPASDATVWDFVIQRALFDSNGFVHYRGKAPTWNPDFKIFCDYEYFLRCCNRWPIEEFALASEIGVYYTQTSEGVIGRSTYPEWADELSQICDRPNRYSILDSEALGALQIAIARWQKKSMQQCSIQAFRP
ncbi:MAG: glycosyltransferase family A protein [Cyanobacteriota bacterium]|nr:glycosyltransferase family A protein [Cyanobacteriota bacterium]